MTKPYNGSTLRDWFSIDDVLWKPLWLLPNEKDPPEVIMVPLNSNGTFTLFGFTFENKSEKPGDEAPYEKSSTCNTIEKSSEVRKYDESEENPEDHLVASSSVFNDSKIIEDSK